VGPDLRRWGVFNLIGFAGFLLQLALVAILTRNLGWSGLAATALAVELVIVVNFCAHARWTWRDHPVSSLADFVVRGVRYQLTKTASFCAGLAVTALAMSLGTSPELANVISVIVCAGPNYLTDRLVFASRIP
jgi:putative flippase GtrA